MTENAKKVVAEIKGIYKSDDVCMGDLLGMLHIMARDELTFEDAFEIYSELMNWANGDVVKICSDE